MWTASHYSYISFCQASTDVLRYVTWRPFSLMKPAGDACCSVLGQRQSPRRRSTNCSRGFPIFGFQWMTIFWMLMLKFNWFNWLRKTLCHFTIISMDSKELGYCFGGEGVNWICSWSCLLSGLINVYLFEHYTCHCWRIPVSMLPWLSAQDKSCLLYVYIVLEGAAVDERYSFCPPTRGWAVRPPVLTILVSLGKTLNPALPFINVLLIDAMCGWMAEWVNNRKHFSVEATG